MLKPSVGRRERQARARARVAKFARLRALRDHAAPGERRGVPRRQEEGVRPAA